MTSWRRGSPDARLTDPEDARAPFETTFAEAQPDVNFVVFEPTWLPEDCTVTDVTLRPELPPGRPEGVDGSDLAQPPWDEGNTAALRTVVEGEDRRLRLKQFLYDSAPPSASVAPLWETPEPTPFDCAGAVGWLGTDYKDNRGACVQRARTQLEVSVLDGSFEDRELERLLSELAPVDPGADAHSIPFHWLNYWVRYGAEPTAVPHGLWAHKPTRPYDAAHPVARHALGDQSVRAPVPAADPYRFDSAVAFPEADAVEAIYRHEANGSDHLWVVAAPPDSPLAPEVPPEPSAQPAVTRECVRLRNTDVHYAALTEDHGAWEAVWSESGTHYAVWASASQHLDGEAFRSLVDELERA